MTQSTSPPVPPPVGAYAIRYFDRAGTAAHIDEVCPNLQCACRRLAEVRKGVDASAYLERRTASGVWRPVPVPAVA